MSAKNLDRHNRWRSKTVAFRVSPEEWEHFEKIVVYGELRRISNGGAVSDEILDTLNLIAVTLGGMKEECK